MVHESEYEEVHQEGERTMSVSENDDIIFTLNCLKIYFEYLKKELLDNEC